MKLRQVTAAMFGDRAIAYTVSEPRPAADGPGPAYRQLYLIPNVDDAFAGYAQRRKLVGGKPIVMTPQPDRTYVAEGEYFPMLALAESFPHKTPTPRETGALYSEWLRGGDMLAGPQGPRCGEGDPGGVGVSAASGPKLSSSCPKSGTGLTAVSRYTPCNRQPCPSPPNRSSSNCVR